ncbi:MAG: hypothetical protein RML38_05910, partial [Bacteroidia bacterium]|nr:hypothetical protein [Bacteroidia bacterium]
HAQKINKILIHTFIAWIKPTNENAAQYHNDEFVFTFATVKPTNFFSDYPQFCSQQYFIAQTSNEYTV